LVVFFISQYVWQTGIMHSWQPHFGQHPPELQPPSDAAALHPGSPALDIWIAARAEIAMAAQMTWNRISRVSYTTNSWFRVGI
jgi:hypothetical protein